MHYREYARLLLEGGELADKLHPAKDLDFSASVTEYELPKNPGRNERLKFQEEQVKFPRAASFHLDDKKGLALHFFANHELMAIEMMAAALLVYPDHTPEMILFKKGLVKTIQDEQKHIKLYLNRMKDFKVELGDFPLNDFFWRAMDKLKTPSHFYSAVALTFESANLDFAKYYEECFLEVEDEATAKIMRIIFEDEISHVALGAHWLNQWRGNKDLWNYYREHLPGVMTPARAKGIHFNRDSRVKSGLDESFINELDSFRDDFKVTNRKNW